MGMFHFYNSCVFTISLIILSLSEMWLATTGVKKLATSDEMSSRHTQNETRSRSPLSQNKSNLYMFVLLGVRV